MAFDILKSIEEKKMVKMPKAIDLTKPQLSWQYILVLIVIVAVLLSAWAIGNYLFNMAKSQVGSLTKRAEEPTI